MGEQKEIKIYTGSGCVLCDLELKPELTGADGVKWHFAGSCRGAPGIRAVVACGKPLKKRKAKG